MLLVGRYHGRFPETLRSKGLLADMTEFSIELKAQKMDIPFEKVQCDLYHFCIRLFPFLTSYFASQLSSYPIFLACDAVD